jgi:hypothetical protein
MPRRRRPLGFDVLGVEEIGEFFLELGKVPQKTVKKAARAGANIIKRETVSTIQLPVRDGFLRMSIKPFQEKTKRNSGKAGFDIAFDRNFNFIFQKKIKNPGIYGGKKATAYYPASMEYGFRTKKGGVGGHHFLERSAVSKGSQAQDKMLEVISKDIDAIKKKG